MTRVDGRSTESIRKLAVQRNYIPKAEGSVLISMGNTRVICTASVEEKVPPFLKGSGTGWITAEYSMLPRATHTRNERESTRGKIGGRTHEIQRVIGRSLRGVVDLTAFGERTIYVDCDVIEADGGTRTASISGGFIALYLAFEKLTKEKVIDKIPVLDTVSAISVGIVNGERLLDLCYEEDSNAEVDMNIVATGSGKLIEVQGTAEKNPFAKQDLDSLIRLAYKGIRKITSVQKRVLKI